MLKRIVVPVLLLLCASTASKAAVPRYAYELSKYSESTKSSEQLTRLRITIVGDVAQSEQSVRMGDVLLCSPAECYRAHTSGYVNIANTASGRAEVIADVSIPIATITDVYFTDVRSRSVIGTHLKLETPLAIEKDFPAVELMIGVRKLQVGTQTTYAPVQSASMYFTDDSELVHYLPSTQTVAELPLGTKLTIPAGALDRPQIFNVGIVKVGEMFPKIDILPYVDLKKPGNIEVRATRNATTKHEFITSVHPPEPNQDSRLPNTPATQQPAKISFSRTAVIEPSTLEKSLPSTASSASSSSSSESPPKSCAEYLAQPIVLGMINLIAANTGAARVSACEKVKPFVHIVYVLIKDSRINFSIPYKTSPARSGNGPYLSLQRITSFGATPSTALINGFDWDGDKGFFEGDVGKALGIVRSGGAALGDNIQGGGTACATCALDDQKFVMAFSNDKAHPTFLTTRSVSELGAFSQNVVSSSTSVIKNGVCQTPGTTSRWSAIGAFNGRMVLISSTTSGQTSAAELCAVFKALAIKDALRLDGGPSTSLMVSGELLNPLDGWDRAKYGLSRRIAYPLRISH